MNVNWIKPTLELEAGIKIINGLDNFKFEKFLNHIKDHSSTRAKSQIFTSEETVALERVFKLSSDEIALLLKITLHILERMSKFIMRPSCVLHDFTVNLKMTKEKAGIFIEVWRTVIKDIAEDYKVKNFGKIDHLGKVNWELDLAVCSHLNKKEKMTKIFLDLKAANEHNHCIEKPTLELTTDELLTFSNQLDYAQLELDSLIKHCIEKM